MTDDCKNTIPASGSPSDKGPFPQGARPLFTVQGDPDSGWTPGEDIPVVLPPPAGGPVVVPDQGAIDADGYPVFTFQRLVQTCADVGLSPDIVNGLIAQLLVQHFSNPDWIMYDELKGYVWNADPGQTKISILPLYKWDELLTGTLPAIVYNDLGHQKSRLAIGDRAHTDGSSDGYAVSVSGSHRLMCIGDTDGSASLLASEVDSWLTQFSPILRQYLPFHDFQVANRAPPQSFTGIGSRIGVALEIQYVYIWSWGVSPAGPPMTSFGPPI